MSPGVSLLMFTIILLLPVSYHLTNKTYGGEPETRTLKAIAGFGGFQDRCITSYANSPYYRMCYRYTKIHSSYAIYSKYLLSADYAPYTRIPMSYVRSRTALSLRGGGHRT